MDAVAAKAGVGKGTVFRRFDSREGLMGALLNVSESAWQASVMCGEPPLGPGAEPMDRLLAFGRSRLDITLQHADLIRNAGFGGANRSYAAYSFAATHVRHLLGELGVRGDIALLAVALLAPLELPILDQQVRIERIDVDRIHAGWADLAHRITERRAPRSAPGSSTAASPGPRPGPAEQLGLDPGHDGEAAVARRGGTAGTRDQPDSTGRCSTSVAGPRG